MIEECAARRVEMLRRLGSVSTIRRAKKLIRAYFRSESARIATLALVAKRNGETDEPDPKWTARMIVEAGRGLLVEEVRKHPVWVQPSKWGEPGSRPVFKFATWDAARASMAHDALKAVIRFPEWMFLFNGGEAAAKRWVKARLPDAALVLVVDFPKCFPLLPWQLVEDGLPLSRRAIEALLFEPWKRAKARGFGLKTAKPKWWRLFTSNSHGDDHGGDDHIGHGNCVREIGAGRGYPPGSVLAAFAAQVALQLMIEEVPELQMDGVEIGVFADNVIIILKNKELEGPVRHGLKALALKHFDAVYAQEFCGRIRPHTPGSFFPYLGRMIRRWKKDVQFYAQPGHCDRIIMRVLDDHVRAQNFEDLRKPIRRMKGFLVHHGTAPNAADAVLQATLYTGALAEQMAAKCGKPDLGDLLEPHETVGGLPGD